MSSEMPWKKPAMRTGIVTHDQRDVVKLSVIRMDSRVLQRDKPETIPVVLAVLIDICPESLDQVNGDVESHGSNPIAELVRVYRIQKPQVVLGLAAMLISCGHG
jgi:hypothetical protein